MKAILCGPAILLTLAFGATESKLHAQERINTATPAANLVCPTTPPFAIDPIGTIYKTVRPTFTWTGAPGAQSYTLYVQYVSDGSLAMPREIGIQGTSFTATVDLPLDVDLRWKVKGEATGCAAGPYSSILPFRLEETPPPNPGCPNLDCFPSLHDCEAACTDGVCERRINCGLGPTGHKCFC